MATKHFCGGCDKEIRSASDIKRVRVSDIAGETVLLNPRDFDLCGGCYGYFKNHMLPTAWVRGVDEKAA
jgi:hypothetical protein